MCAAVTKDYQEHLIKDGEVVPSVFRVNTVLQNDENFAKAFKCSAGTTMNPATRVEVY
jgi:predicted metalloendopeptidase